MSIRRDLPVVESDVTHVTPTQVKLLNVYDSISKLYLDPVNELLTTMKITGKM